MLPFESKTLTFIVNFFIFSKRYLGLVEIEANLLVVLVHLCFNPATWDGVGLGTAHLQF